MDHAVHQENDKRLKILLLEDDGEVATRIQTMLAAWPHAQCRLHAVARLALGLEALADWPFDAVLLDLGLPDSTGLETLARTQAAAPELPIVVLCGPGDKALVSQAAAQGAMGIVFKEKMDAARLCRTLEFAVALNHGERTIRHKESKYRRIIENLKDAYYECDLTGNFAYVNDEVVRHLGRPREQLIGMNNRDYTTADLAKRMYKAFAGVYQTGNTGRLDDYALPRPDGTTINVELCISLMRDSQGQPIGFSGISRDVSDKLAARKALRESEEKYRNILDNMQDAYVENDLTGRYTYYNPAAGSVFGYTDEELKSMDNRAVMDEENARIIYQAYRRIYETGEPNPFLQFEILTKTGERRFIESSVSLMRDRQGQAMGFRGIYRDITERKAAELELARAKEKAEAATRAKSEFLANMSHEIRTPMNGIIGMYNLLEGTQLNAEQADFVATGKLSSDALMGVINDILDFSKIEAGKLDIENIDFDLRNTIDDLVLAPARRAHEKGLELVYNIHHEVPSLLRGDPARLRQVIMNLMMNAIKFTPKGEVSLFVDLQEETESKVMLRFSVKDTGIGIAKADQARLFRSFQQVDNSSTRRYGGTGLGLAIGKRLSELMDGRMGVESDTGKGATFWFTAKLDKSAAHGQAPLIVPEAIKDKRILIVDDNKTNLDILEGYLKLWGCGCDRAASGELALALMQAVVKAGAPYDLVITDMVMPGMDGAELGRRIKADAALRATILIMLTSQGLRGDAAEMKRVGYSAYLTKPVRPSTLFDCLVAVLSRGQSKVQEEKSAPIVTSYTLSEARRRNLRLLLAEDNIINQKLALHLLKRFGFSADVVSDGKAALQALSSTAYDLVLMDIEMPEMDGFETTRSIRNPQSGVLNHAVPVIAMTARVTQQDHQKCLAEGMDGYVTKPFQPNELLRTIEKIIAGQTPRGDEIPGMKGNQEEEAGQA